MRIRTLSSSLTIASCAIAVATSSLVAQSSTRPLRFVVTGGMTVPQGDLKTFNDVGAHAAGSLLINIMGLTLRPELSLTRLKQKALASLATPAPTVDASTPSTQMLAAMGNIELPLVGGLFVLAGVGLQNLDASTTTRDLSQSKVMINAGAGFRFHLGPADGFIEARLGKASYDAGKVGYTKAQMIPVSFGLVF